MNETGKNAFRIWTPSDSVWSGWVKPIPFVMYDLENQCSSLVTPLKIPQLLYTNEVRANTAMMVDLHDISAIEEGIALAQLGYRPVPVYNGTCPPCGSIALIENRGIMNALVMGAKLLENIEFSNFALPTFLLDSNRVFRCRKNSPIFDNGYDIYAQDLPSADFFIKQQISKIIVRCNNHFINDDIKIILYKYQQKGIKIFSCCGYEKEKEVSIKKPPSRIVRHFS